VIDQILIDILASNRIFKEGFSNNQRIGSSESFEEHFSQELIKMGFTDYTDEWLLFRVDRNTKTFCDYDSKGEANAYIKQFKDLLEVDPFTTVKMLKPDMGFIEQPLSSKRQPCPDMVDGQGRAQEIPVSGHQDRRGTISKGQ